MGVALRSINQTHLLSPDLNSPYKVCIENLIMTSASRLPTR